MADIIRELREDYPAVDVTTVVFGREFAGVGCCVIPQDRVLVMIGEIEGLRAAIVGILKANDEFRAGRCCGRKPSGDSRDK